MAFLKVWEITLRPGCVHSALCGQCYLLNQQITLKNKIRDVMENYVYITIRSICKDLYMHMYSYAYTHECVYCIFSPVFWHNSRWSSPYNMYFSNFLVSFPQNSLQAINHYHQPLSLRTLNHPSAMKSCFIVFNLCQFSQKEEIDTTLYFSNILPCKAMSSQLKAVSQCRCTTRYESYFHPFKGSLNNEQLQRGLLRSYVLFYSCQFSVNLRAKEDPVIPRKCYHWPP